MRYPFLQRPRVWYVISAIGMLVGLLCLAMGQTLLGVVNIVGWAILALPWIDIARMRREIAAIEAQSKEMEE
jgi:hypothetical protein